MLTRRARGPAPGAGLPAAGLPAAAGPAGRAYAAGIRRLTKGTPVSETWPSQRLPAPEPPPELDTSVAHPARVYDYWLGGKDNFAADREAAERVLAVTPGLRFRVRANRAFLARAVRYLVSEAGIRQFLDIGTGIPTASNTHEVAQGIAGDARVVYVDNDPIVLAHARALLTSTPAGACAYLASDLRKPGPILRQAAATLDFGQPVAIMLLGILHLISDAEDPYQLVRQLTGAVPSGSYLAISHPASDIADNQREAQQRYNERVSTPQTLRSEAEVARFFDGLELVPPGLVAIHTWRPDGPVPPGATSAHGGVARKP
ncbi:MAG: SAM-dependent methyltransferase [Actinobacteria bacterium]|nr:SAM-dependent methyltransferase [Actinomycetota bacterium]